MYFVQRLHRKQSLALFVQALRFVMIVRCAAFAMAMPGILAYFGLNCLYHVNAVKVAALRSLLTMV